MWGFSFVTCSIRWAGCPLGPYLFGHYWKEILRSTLGGWKDVVIVICCCVVGWNLIIPRHYHQDPAVFFPTAGFWLWVLDSFYIHQMCSRNDELFKMDKTRFYQTWLCITKPSACYLRLCFATAEHSGVRFNYWRSYGFLFIICPLCHQTRWIIWCERMEAFSIPWCDYSHEILFQLKCIMKRLSKWSFPRGGNLFLCYTTQLLGWISLWLKQVVFALVHLG